MNIDFCISVVAETDDDHMRETYRIRADESLSIWNSYAGIYEHELPGTWAYRDFEKRKRLIWRTDEYIRQSKIHEWMEEATSFAERMSSYKAGYYDSFRQRVYDALWSMDEVLETSFWQMDGQK